MSVYSKDKFVTLLTYGYVVTGIQKMQGISVQLTAGSVSERLKMDLGEKYKKDKCEVITVCEDKSFRNEKKKTHLSTILSDGQLHFIPSHMDMNFNFPT